MRAVPRAVPSRGRELVGRDARRWLLGAARIAPVWSLCYGLLALSWAFGCAGYPFS
jgi:hypothetical protein